MAMFVPLADSTAAGMAVKGGAMTMSQWEEETAGANAEKKARVSACVLNIFQFPAISGRRVIGGSVQNSEEECSMEA